jgi:hypothetical protein
MDPQASGVNRARTTREQQMIGRFSRDFPFVFINDAPAYYPGLYSTAIKVQEESGRPRNDRENRESSIYARPLPGTPGLVMIACEAFRSSSVFYGCHPE